jgi:WD40 repeat protein
MFFDREKLAAVSSKYRSDVGGDPSDGILVRYWDLSKKAELGSLHIKSLIVAEHTSFFPGANLVVGYRLKTKTVVVYRLPEMQEKATLQDCPPATLRFASDGKTIVAAIGGETDPQLCLYTVEGGQLVNKLKLVPANAKKIEATAIKSVEFSPDGTMIAVGTINPMKIHVVRSDLSGTVFTLEPEFPFYPECVKFSPDNAMLAVKKERNAVHLYSLQTKEAVRIFGKNPEGVNGWCFSPDGAWIAIACGGHPSDSKLSASRVRVFEVKTGKLVAELE